MLIVLKRYLCLDFITSISSYYFNCCRVNSLSSRSSKVILFYFIIVIGVELLDEDLKFSIGLITSKNLSGWFYFKNRKVSLFSSVKDLLALGSGCATALDADSANLFGSRVFWLGSTDDLLTNFSTVFVSITGLTAVSGTLLNSGFKHSLRLIY